MKALLSYLLLLAVPAAAQRPTAGPARPLASFWPINYPTGTVVFSEPTVHPMAPGRTQTEHLRSWLTSTTWTELQTQADSTQLYQGKLRGVHAGIALRFAVQVRRQQTGWQYTLLAFQVRSPTGDPNIAHWLPLHQLLNDPDFRPDVTSFQQQLQRALSTL